MGVKHNHVAVILFFSIIKTINTADFVEILFSLKNLLVNLMRLHNIYKLINSELLVNFIMKLR